MEQINSNYEKAILHYEQQKKDILAFYNYQVQFQQNIAYTKEEEEFYNNLLQLEENYIQKGFNYYSDIFNEIDSLIGEQFVGNSAFKKSLQAKIQNKAKNSKNKILQGTEGYSKLIEQEVQNYFMGTTLWKKLVSELNMDARTSGQIKGYITRKLSTIVNNRYYQNKFSKRSRLGYLSALKGYYAEDAIADALNKKILSLNNVTGKATTIGGKNEITDIIVELQNTANNFSGDIVGTSEVKPIIKFGIQAKAYDLSKLEFANLNKMQNFSFAVGNNNQLYSKAKNEINLFEIHEVFSFLSQYVTQVLGEKNSIYSISSTSLIFTCDLIRKFKEANYLLAFDYDKEKGSTKHISWRKCGF